MCMYVSKILDTREVSSNMYVSSLLIFFLSFLILCPAGFVFLAKLWGLCEMQLKEDMKFRVVDIFTEVQSQFHGQG